MKNRLDVCDLSHEQLQILVERIREVYVKGLSDTEPSQALDLIESLLRNFNLDTECVN